jgi:probable F420-dependent oxidoreductase
VEDLMDQVRDHLGQFGVWRNVHVVPPELAADIEKAGFGTLWVGGSPPGDLAAIEKLLAATSTLVVGTSIVNIWQDDAATVAASWHRLAGRFPGRFILGVGAGHPEATASYVKPYTALAEYLDTLLAAGVPASDIVLAALGPRALRLAGERAGGALPYLVTTAHTPQAREILGPGPLLAPEHKVVLDTNPQRARDIGRPRVQNPYLGLVNYTSSLLRLGWSEADIANGGSDALIDALVLHGSADQVAAGLREHLAAGADHVVIQLLTKDDGEFLVPGYQELATALGL